jgi:hypothetical protein
MPRVYDSRSPRSFPGPLGLDLRKVKQKEGGNFFFYPNIYSSTPTYFEIFPFYPYLIL